MISLIVTPVEHAVSGQAPAHFPQPSIAEVVLEEGDEELVERPGAGRPDHGDFLATRQPAVGHDVEVVVGVILVEVREAQGGDIPKGEGPLRPFQHAVLRAVAHVDDVVPALVLDHRAGAGPLQAGLRIARADGDDAELGRVRVWRDRRGRPHAYRQLRRVGCLRHSGCRVESLDSMYHLSDVAQAVSLDDISVSRALTILSPWWQHESLRLAPLDVVPRRPRRPSVRTART